MNRRQFVCGGIASTVTFNAWANPKKEAQFKWMIRIKGWLCQGCGRKLKDKLVKMPGVVSTTVDVKIGNVELLTSDKRAGEKSIRETIGKTNFKVVSITGPTKIKR